MLLAAVSCAAVLFMGGTAVLKVILLALSVEAGVFVSYLAVTRGWKLWPRERAALMLGAHFLFGLVVLAAYMVEV
jgi:hypothetical protein